MKKIFLTVGLGFGDEGKGTVVDFLSKEFDADLIVRYTGGHQCGHNVQTPDGRHHCFSQFGSGAFHGVRTYFGRNMIMEPTALLREANHLRELGVGNGAFYISIHNRTLVANPFFQALNRAKARLNGHGSCGAGVGETRRYYLEHGNDSIFAENFRHIDIMQDKLHLIKTRVIEEMRQLGVLNTNEGRYVLGASTHYVAKDMKANLYEACNPSFCAKMPNFETAVFEGAQGVLLDENFGFQPYTTWSTTTTRPAWDEIYEMEDDTVDITTIGITRSYMTRHGAGPFPSEDNLEGHKLNHPEPHNPYNPWQTDFRQGPLDFVLLKYALQYAGKIDGLFVTHLDRPNALYIDEQSCYDLETLNKQEDKTRWLQGREPDTKWSHDILATIEDQLKLPILGTSSGPTYEDKLWRGAVAV